MSKTTTSQNNAPTKIWKINLLNETLDKNQVLYGFSCDEKVFLVEKGQKGSFSFGQSSTLNTKLPAFTFPYSYPLPFAPINYITSMYPPNFSQPSPSSLGTVPVGTSVDPSNQTPFQSPPVMTPPVTPTIETKKTQARKFYTYQHAPIAVTKGFAPASSTLPFSVTALLNKWFDENYHRPYLDYETKKALCEETGLSLDQLDRWCQDKHKSARSSNSSTAHATLLLEARMSNSTTETSNIIEQTIPTVSRDFSNETCPSASHYSPQVVNILYKWLYENINNPFPTSEIKAYLCGQTGLTMEALDQWFDYQLQIEKSKYSSHSLITNSHFSHSSMSIQKPNTIKSAAMGAIRPDKVVKKLFRERPNHGHQVTGILTKWFNAHIDHPYPNDETKKHLCIETGITVDQLNHWFINQRRRSGLKFSKEKMGYASGTSSQGNSVAVKVKKGKLEVDSRYASTARVGDEGTASGYVTIGQVDQDILSNDEQVEENSHDEIKVLSNGGTGKSKPFLERTGELVPSSRPPHDGFVCEKLKNVDEALK